MHDRLLLQKGDYCQKKKTKIDNRGHYFNNEIDKHWGVFLIKKTITGQD
jgi:hypothetical protein